MSQKLLTPEQAAEYGSIVSTYHPNGQVVFNFARSKVAVIAGPTGVGKDTLRETLLQNPVYVKILSTTSRPPRPGEQEGVEYHFRDLNFFEEGFNERRFLQAAMVHNQQLSCIDSGDIASIGPDQIGLCLLVVQTEIQLRKLNPDLKTIFLIPPSLSELLSRIQQTRQVEPAELHRRTEAAVTELQIALSNPSYYCMVNDQIDRIKQLSDDFLIRGVRNEQEDISARQTAQSVLQEFGNYTG